MTPDEKYLFDLNGYLVVENLLTRDELALANEAIDKHAHQIQIRGDSLADNSPTLVGKEPRGELGGLQSFEEPYGRLFRHFLTHPRLVPYLHEILGKGFRLDHDMALLTMNNGTEGFYFHGKAGPDWDTDEFYMHRNGKIYCGLTVVSIQLADVNACDGGFAVVPGSHKANFLPPKSLLRYEQYGDNIRQVVSPAGSAVIFTEAITHGTLPWKASHQRRTLLTRYTRANMAYVPPRPTPDWATSERDQILTQQPFKQERFGRKGLPEA